MGDAGLDGSPPSVGGVIASESIWYDRISFGDIEEGIEYALIGISQVAGTTGPEMMVLTLGDVERELLVPEFPFTGRNPSSTIAFDMGMPLASRIFDGGSN